MRQESITQKNTSTSHAKRKDKSIGISVKSLVPATECTF